MNLIWLFANGGMDDGPICVCSSSNVCHAPVMSNDSRRKGKLRGEMQSRLSKSCGRVRGGLPSHGKAGRRCGQAGALSAGALRAPLQSGKAAHGRGCGVPCAAGLPIPLLVTEPPLLWENPPSVHVDFVGLSITGPHFQPSAEWSGHAAQVGQAARFPSGSCDGLSNRHVTGQADQIPSPDLTQFVREAAFS